MEASQGAKVYVWETKVGDHAGMRSDESTVGHASMELPNGQYVSVRPKYGISVNPFTTFVFPMPVPAKGIGSLKEDVDIEDRGPDRTIMVPLTDREIASISAKSGQLESDMRDRRCMYQLLPGVGVVPVARTALGAVQRVSSFLGYNHVGENVGFPEATHCSEAITSLLGDAGVPVPERTAPWKITPSELGNYLETLKNRFNSDDGARGV